MPNNQRLYCQYSLLRNHYCWVMYILLRQSFSLSLSLPPSLYLSLSLVHHHQYRLCSTTIVPSLSVLSPISFLYLSFVQFFTLSLNLQVWMTMTRRLHQRWHVIWTVISHHDQNASCNNFWPPPPHLLPFIKIPKRSKVRHITAFLSIVRCVI